MLTQKDKYLLNSANTVTWEINNLCNVRLLIPANIYKVIVDGK